MEATEIILLGTLIPAMVAWVFIGGRIWQSVKDLKSSLFRIEAKNDSDHQMITKEIGTGNERISRIEGYMNGYESQEAKREAQRKLDNSS